MANRRRAHDDEAWTTAKKICRLTARQVEMARMLGMNPKKLPGLRPSPHERWKLPVGEFIEECYRKRFGVDAGDHDRSFFLVIITTCILRQSLGHRERFLHRVDDVLIVRIEEVTE